VSYIDFLTPAMLAVTTVMAGTNAGVAAAIDHTNGLHDRFAALPIPPSLAGLARTINETVFAIGRALVLLGGAALLGFRFHGDVIDAVAGLVVLVVLAGAMSALFGRIGDRLRRPDVVQFAGMMVMMPFMFVSSAFAPLDTMPGWMRTLAALNPVAHAADALRGNVLGTATLGDTVAALVAAAALWILVTIIPRRTRNRRAAATT
jgi:ABC-2 type transport system permease protein